MIVDEKNYISEFQAHNTCFLCNLFVKTQKSIFEQFARFERTLSSRISDHVFFYTLKDMERIIYILSSITVWPENGCPGGRCNFSPSLNGSFDLCRVIYDSPPLPVKKIKAPV